MGKGRGGNCRLVFIYVRACLILCFVICYATERWFHEKDGKFYGSLGSLPSRRALIAIIPGKAGIKGICQKYSLPFLK